eukprot:843903-Prorocentrum_minimum.AAC.2
MLAHLPVHYVHPLYCCRSRVPERPQERFRRGSGGSQEGARRGPGGGRSEAHLDLLVAGDEVAVMTLLGVLVRVRSAVQVPVVNFAVVIAPLLPAHARAAAEG